MQRVDTPSAISSLPAQEPAGTPGYFTKGDPAQSVPATVPGQDWFNAVQEELMAVIEEPGITPDKATTNQVLTALQMLGLRAATESNIGVAKIATQALVDAGLDDTTIVTPKKLEAAIAALINSAPGALDTLNELAAALGDDPNFATTVTNALASKQSLDATLTALAGVVTAANKLIYATGSDTFATTDFVALARSLLAAATPAAAQAVLEVPSLADANAIKIQQSGVISLSSGASVDFTSIPATAKSIVVTLAAVSVNGNSIPIALTLGGASGFFSTGYLSSVREIIDGSTEGITSYIKCVTQADGLATMAVSGTITMTHAGQNRWDITGILRDEAREKRWLVHTRLSNQAEPVTQIRFSAPGGQFDGVGQAHINWQI